MITKVFADLQKALEKLESIPDEKLKRSYGTPPTIAKIFGKWELIAHPPSNEVMDDSAYRFHLFMNEIRHHSPDITFVFKSYENSGNFYEEVEMLFFAGMPNFFKKFNPRKIKYGRGEYFPWNPGTAKVQYEKYWAETNEFDAALSLIKYIIEPLSFTTAVKLIPDEEYYKDVRKSFYFPGH